MSPDGRMLLSAYNVTDGALISRRLTLPQAKFALLRGALPPRELTGAAALQSLFFETEEQAVDGKVLGEAIVQQMVLTSVIEGELARPTGITVDKWGT